MTVPRFLEIGVYAPDIQASLAFYESLGLAQAPVGEAWGYPYAVVTDGRLALGLHGAAIATPRLTFVYPDLQHAISMLEANDYVFEDLSLGNEVFNTARTKDPNDLSVLFVEARTFSPAPLAGESTCGYFSEFGIPARDPATSAAFWEPLGFVCMDEDQTRFPRTILASDLLNLGLYRSRALRYPTLTFTDSNMRERLSRLRERGFTLCDEMPDSLDEACNSVLIAPEGTRLLLLQDADS